MATTLRRLRPVLPFVLLFVVALGVRLYRLDAQSLWLDEGGSWAEVTGRTGKGWGTLVGELFSPDAGYPLYHLLLKGWVALVGDSEWALRFPSALAGALAVLVLMRMGSAFSLQRHIQRKSFEYWFQDQKPAFSIQHSAFTILLLGLLAIASPFLLWHAQDAKAYSLLLLLVSLLFLMTLHALAVGGRAWLWVLVVALISVFVHRLALLAVASAALGALLEISGQMRGESRKVGSGKVGSGKVGSRRVGSRRVGSGRGERSEGEVGRYETPDTRHQTPDTRHQTPDTRGGSGRGGRSEGDTRHQTRDTRHETPDTRGGSGRGGRSEGEAGRPETREPRPETREPRPESRDPRPETRDPRGGSGRGEDEQGIYTTKLPFPGFRLVLMGIAVLGAFAGLAGTLRAAGGERAFISRSGIGPFESLWLTLLRFSVDRWPGDMNGFLGLPLVLWLLPFTLLGLWGLLLLLRDAWAGRPGAAFVLCILAMPLVLVMLLTALSPIYEARYTIVAFPGWLMVLGYPGFRGQGAGGRRTASGEGNSATEQHEDTLATHNALHHSSFAMYHVLVALAVLVSVVTLFQPKKGIFSGDALKEQWRDGVQYLARHVQPDDLLLIHPSYVAIMYDYYAARVTPDPLPSAITFPIFAEGHVCGLENPTQKQAHECWVRRYDPAFNQAAFGKKRALLLIAPDHARTVDPPKSLEELIAETPQGQTLPTQADRYGGLGLRFEYPQDTWPCGGTGNALIGVEVMCQSYPESFHAGGPGSVPEPDTRLEADFGNELHLRGFSIRPLGHKLRPGGALPITLYWSALEKPTQNYRMFLHICQDCSMPPLANNDGPPLAGLFPAGETSSWQPGDPVHDERSLVLPADLAPGRYTLILGVYAGDGSEASRLAISHTAEEVLSARRLVLGEVVIGDSR